ncbi:hypothetical protein NT2_04_03890 [Caenibius tardaugens NBRC 16725]|uniref:DUF4124 domain-containing protein n=2 Tax=Caenibius TaxID=2827482 RepID=U2Y715_9SPHN|nr:hypothetical protein NT2_04_03890 [Caenibius tardaugens NBRC 16725]
MPLGREKGGGVFRHGVEMMKRLIAVGFSALTLAAWAAPAAAQDQDYKVNQLIIYGDDACPQSTAGEITVCARKAENERYRIPEDLRLSGDPANKAWTERVLAYETVGATGTNSCSPVGMGGEFGCTQKLLAAARGEAKESGADRFGELIAKAREERLSTVDADAAEEQGRVEQLEKEHEERKAAEAAAGTVESPDDPVQ